MIITKLSTARFVTATLALLGIVFVVDNRANAWSLTNTHSISKTSNSIYRSTARSPLVIRLEANVASEILMSKIKEEEEEATASTAASMASSSTESKPKPKGKKKLPRSERKKLEREKKKNAGKKNNNGKNKNKKKYNLHSTNVSRLTASSTADDVLAAIKRAQRLHDQHDLRVIANFLIDECDVGFAYGYRGSLLARLAVAALHWDNHDVARRAIEIRRLEYRASMRPMESAAIVRGLLRVHNVTDALGMIADELSLPMEVSIYLWVIVLKTIL